jgi:hypothetical protein
MIGKRISRGVIVLLVRFKRWDRRRAFVNG